MRHLHTLLLGWSCHWDPKFMFCLNLHFIFGKFYLDTGQREHWVCS
jgi:hypothetical protein